METKLLICVCVCYGAALLIGLSSAQIIIPPRPLGYVYKNGSSDAPIHLDIHMGPLCPDSAAVFPTVKQVAEYYKQPTLKLTLHMFPLPYHHQAYLTAIGAQAMRKVVSTANAYQYFDEVYNNLDKLSNDATRTMNTDTVIDTLASIAVKCGIDRNQFVDSMKDGVLENKVRTAWKYSCSRGISGTPTVLINDVIVDADPSWSLDDWKKVIDPLLQQTYAVNDVPSNDTCKIGTRRCEFLPGKIECCTKGEACIPNVGCRCFDVTHDDDVREEHVETREGAEVTEMDMIEIKPIV